MMAIATQHADILGLELKHQQSFWAKHMNDMKDRA